MIHRWQRRLSAFTERIGWSGLFLCVAAGARRVLGLEMGGPVGIGHVKSGSERRNGRRCAPSFPTLALAAIGLPAMLRSGRMLVTSERHPGRGERRVLFFSRTKDRRLLELLEFYSEDIAALREIGFTVLVENRIWRAMFARADLCYSWWWATALPVVVVWRMRGKPVVATGASDDPLAPRSAARSIVLALCTRACLRAASVNLAISDFELADLQRLGARKSRRLYLSVDSDYYVPGHEASAPTAVIIAQLNPASIRRKGVDIAIGAASIVRRTCPEFRLLILGPVQAGGIECLDVLRGAMEVDGIEIVGEVSRQTKRDLLSSAWLYLQPSVLEGFGMAVAEAMACGTVPICSANGSLPEIVGQAGVIVPERTPEAMASAMMALIRDAQRRASMASSARSRAVGQFGRQARAARLRTILSDTGVPC